jgi:hypothetical protein
MLIIRVEVNVEVNVNDNELVEVNGENIGHHENVYCCDDHQINFYHNKVEFCYFQ